MWKLQEICVKIMLKLSECNKKIKNGIDFFNFKM